MVNDNNKASPPGDVDGASDDKSSPTGPGYEATVRTGDTNISVDLSSVPVSVQNINFDGLGRTKDEFVQKAISDVFLTKNFEQLILKIGRAQNKLQSLGVFSEVATVVDTSKGDDAIPDGYDVTFAVKELRRVNGGVSGMVGTNEGTVQAGINFPNVLGSGEKVSLNHFVSSSSGKKSEICVMVPFPYIGTEFSTSLYSCRSINPWSAVGTSATGNLLKYDMKIGKNDTLSVQWHGVWRCLNALDSITPTFPVREYFGNTIKSAFRFIYATDKRDQPIFPCSGTLRKVDVEFAGAFGDAKFLKVETDWQYNWSLFENVVLQGSLRCGLLQPLSSSPLSYNINDLFFLGGPSSLRGFHMRGVGPRCQQNALGGKVVWASAIHLYAPLPFLNSKFSFTENLRFHGFVNCGGIGQTVAECSDADNVRISTGVGLAYRFRDAARVEINYCYPFKFSAKDRCVNGFQWGIGVDFL